MKKYLQQHEIEIDAICTKVSRKMDLDLKYIIFDIYIDTL